MFVIFEGVDLVGKTTIAKELVKNSNFGYFNYFKIKKVYPKNWMDHIDLCAQIEYSALKQVQDDLVLDRSFISSILYNDVFKRGHKVDYINFDDFKGSTYVYVTLDKNKLTQRLEQRVEDKKIVDSIFELSEAYQDFFESFKFPYLKLDGSRKVEDNVSLIQNFIKES